MSNKSQTKHLTTSDAIKRIDQSSINDIMNYYQKLEPELFNFLSEKTQEIAEQIQSKSNMNEMELSKIQSSMFTLNLKVAAIVNMRRNAIDRRFDKIPDFIHTFGESEDIRKAYVSGELPKDRYINETDEDIQAASARHQEQIDSFIELNQITK